MQLTSEQTLALKQGQPVSVIVDHTECIMVRKDVYEEPLGESKHIDQFPDKAERLVLAGYIDTGIDLIYDAFDELLRAGKFADCDLILTDSRVSELSADILLAMLTATLPARSQLVSRSRFFSQVEHELGQRGELEPGLLSGLNG